MGGVYADVDTESRKPLDSIIKAKDTLLVGWENEFATQEIAAHRNYARTRQVLQWVFAAAPGHPALREICDHIAQNVYTQFSQNTNRDTLERTGPGVFTDYVLKHAAMHPPSKVCASKLELAAYLEPPTSGVGRHPAECAYHAFRSSCCQSKSLHSVM